jgi:hypothetical protein
MPLMNSHVRPTGRSRRPRRPVTPRRTPAESLEHRVLMSSSPALHLVGFDTRAGDNAVGVVMDYTGDAGRAYSASVDFGDGTVETMLIDPVADRGGGTPAAGVPAGSPYGTVYAGHRYADAAARQVVVTLTDDAGAAAAGAAFLAAFSPESADAAAAGTYGPMPQGPTSIESAQGDAGVDDHDAAESTSFSSSSSFASSPMSPTAMSMPGEGDAAAPRVSAVLVGSTAWQPGFRNHLGAGGAFDVAAGAPQLDELPWNNLNQVSVRFSEPVAVAPADLLVRGANTAAYPAPAAVSYDASTNTAT